MSNIFFTSDTHYHHKNIVRGTTNWEDSNGGIHGKQRTRDFNTLEDHDAALVARINELVGEDDILYHLGDWSFGGIEQVWEFRKKIRCKTIHLRFGNHDHHIEANRDLPNVHWSYDEEGRGIMVDGPCPRVKGYDKGLIRPVRAQELFKSAEYYSFGKIGVQTMALSHFSMRVWDKGHHGAWMLYGHSHGTLPEYAAVKGHPTKKSDLFKTMDVGVDTNGLYPYRFEEIAKKMEGRTNLLVDHHNETTS